MRDETKIVNLWDRLQTPFMIIFIVCYLKVWYIWQDHLRSVVSNTCPASLSAGGSVAGLISELPRPPATRHAARHCCEQMGSVSMFSSPRVCCRLCMMTVSFLSFGSELLPSWPCVQTKSDCEWRWRMNQPATISPSSIPQPAPAQVAAGFMETHSL